ncbi:helix-turn-helix domain-containing protein [Pseudomonas kilonensis]
MTQITQLISTLKQRLKAAGMTYRDVAQALDLSEPSVKRLLASGRLTLERLAQLCELLGLTMAELLQEAERSTPRLQTLTREQEAQLVSNEKLLLVAVCALNHWSLEDIVSAYCVSKAECIKNLLVLERMASGGSESGESHQVAGNAGFRLAAGRPYPRVLPATGFAGFHGQPIRRPR